MAKALPLKKGSYWISAKWGYSSGAGHFAYDLATNGTGHPVYSITDGTVVACNDGVWDNYTHGLGGPFSGKASNWIVIQFKNRKTGKTNYAFYQHLKRGIKVKKGQRVQPGQHIGNVGLTGNTSGPHLHLAVADHAYKGNRYSYMDNNGGGATWTPMSVAMEIPVAGAPAPAPVPAPARPTVTKANVKPGKKNADVKVYQKELRRVVGPRVAAKLNPGGATGYFGKETRTLTRWVQINKLGAKRGTPGADGVPGAKTFKLLGLHTK